MTSSDLTRSNMMLVYATHLLGLCSLRGWISYSNISWSLKVASFGFNFSNCFPILIWQQPRQLAGVCRISGRSDHDNIQSRGFETPRDLAVRHLTPQWIHAQIRLTKSFPRLGLSAFNRYHSTLIYFITRLQFTEFQGAWSCCLGPVRYNVHVRLSSFDVFKTARQ